MDILDEHQATSVIKVGQNNFNGTIGILVSDGDRDCSSIWNSDSTCKLR